MRIKKLLGAGLLATSLLTLASCGGKGCDLLILNWGDYLSEDVLKAFQKETGLKVKEVTADSNEAFYSKILNRNAKYDIVVPSDYMIDQMKQDDLIYEIDFTKLKNYKDNIFVSELNELMNSDDCKDYKNYYVPYFMGSLGIMYSKKNHPEIENIIKENEWKVLFERDLLPAGTKVGMYNSSRDALAAAELYYGYSLNSTDKNEIDECMNLLKKSRFDAWGTDDLKIKISQHNLDVALVYSGDFFDAFYSDIEAGAIDNVEQYDIYAPKTHNNVFFDSLVIPKTSSNIDAAYQFIDFMLSDEALVDIEDNDEPVSPSYANASFVGYCPTIQAVYDEIFADDEGFGDITSIEAYDPTRIINADSSWAEVYRYLGADIYAYIEDKFTEVIVK